MAKGNKLTKSEVLASYEYDDRRIKNEKAFANKVTSCYRCLKANPSEVVYDQSEERYYADDRVKFVHDQKFNCEILTYKKKDYVINCANGYKKDPQKCSNCVHAENEITVNFMNPKANKKEKVSEMRILYRCSKHNEKGHYYRANFSCDDYKEK